MIGIFTARQSYKRYKTFCVGYTWAVDNHVKCFVMIMDKGVLKKVFEGGKMKKNAERWIDVSDVNAPAKERGRVQNELSAARVEL